MKLDKGHIVAIFGLGGVITGIVLLADNLLGLAFLLGGVGALLVAWQFLGVKPVKPSGS